MCEDKEKDCSNWAAEGDCESNWEHMLTKCPQSCGPCSRLESFARSQPSLTAGRAGGSVLDTWLPIGTDDAEARGAAARWDNGSPRPSIKCGHSSPN